MQHSWRQPWLWSVGCAPLGSPCHPPHTPPPQDFKDALQEVADGYVTDDMVQEKRGMAAVILRRLEVEEWDKQRMRHFYYGLYGMGPWYWDMEERLHNPFFIGARAWNGPIEGWLGRNRTFDDDMPNVDYRENVVQSIGRQRGKPIDPETAKKLVAKETPKNVDYILGSRLFKDVINPVPMRGEIEARSAATTQAAAY